ncbi:MAG: cyclic nucleotide-binding/CBS domain-containing protein [Candidatus Bathyarchaeia archaeon]
MCEGKAAIDARTLSPVKVAHVMVKQVIAANSDLTVREAVNLMNKFEIGCLIVLTNGKVNGIVTERDILKRVIGNSRDVNKTKIKEIMSRPVLVIEPNAELETALKHMLRMKIKKLPVVEKGTLVGLVTLTDIARFQPKILNKFKKLLVGEQTPKRIQRVANCYIS